MCGICGVIGGDRRQVEPAVRRMMRAMVHRGPDDEGYEELTLGDPETGPIAGFGFRRLAILDLSAAGHQPMFNPQTGDCLIFNGEIYNFKSLRAQLQCEGVRFRSTSDTEVLLHALSRWGEAAIPKLEGMYAFAFYHADSKSFLIARDPLGIKPLYVANVSGRFIFASEIRAVMASGFVQRELDLAGISGMLAYGAFQHPRTVFREIRSVPAGCLQRINGSIAAQTIVDAPHRFWKFPVTRSIDDESRAVRTVREILRDAVHRHLVADVPVGVFLSAGIDSTVMASLARDFTPKVMAFTVGFGAVHGEDEVALASQTAKALGIEHVSVELDAANMPQKWYSWLSGMDSPSVDGFNTYVVSSLLKAEGVAVGLSGLGADELFGGYPTFTRATRLSSVLQSLRWLPSGLRKTTATAIGAAIWPSVATEKLADLMAGESSVEGITLALRRSLSDKRIRSMNLAPDRVGLEGNYLEQPDQSSSLTMDRDGFNAVSRTEMTHYMRDTLLRDTDAVSMRHSLEVRVPFLDFRLVEYVSTLPGHLKQGHAPKALLRKAGSAVLSAKISNRPKTGFTLPIGDWMRGAMREPCEFAISTLAGQSFIDGAEVTRTWRTFLGDAQSMHWSRPLSLVVLGTYLC